MNRYTHWANLTSGKEGVRGTLVADEETDLTIDSELQRMTLDQYVNSTAEDLILDPLVNAEILELRKELVAKELECQKLKDDLNTATFTADSVIGRRLIQKCKHLQKENHDLGRVVAESHIIPAHLGSITLEKKVKFLTEQLVMIQELNNDLDEENEKLTNELRQLKLKMKDDVKDDYKKRRES